MSNGISNYKWLITIRPTYAGHITDGPYYVWVAKYKEYEILKNYYYNTKQKAIDGWDRFARSNGITKYKILKEMYYGKRADD